MQAKTGVEGPEQAEMVRGMVQEYVRGLCWVMRYYYDGAPTPLNPPHPALNNTDALTICGKY